MNSDHGAGATNHQPNDSAARPTNGSGSGSEKESGFVQRVMSRAMALASQLDDQNPAQAVRGARARVSRRDRRRRVAFIAPRPRHPDKAATAAAVEVSRSFLRQQLAKA